MTEIPAQHPRFLVALITAPDADAAAMLARALVSERLAACVNRIPGVTSLFHWQGELDQAQEELLLVKLRHEDFEVLRQRVVELHPYDCPEVLALPVLAGHPDYLQWLETETRR